MPSFRSQRSHLKSQVALQFSQLIAHWFTQPQYVLAVVHVVVTPSQVMEVPGMLVQEVMGVQLKTAPPEQVVVQDPV